MINAKQVQRIYDQNIIQHIDFVETLGTNIQFHEMSRYNYNTGLPNYSARFRGHHGYKLPVIDIDRRGVNVVVAEDPPEYYYGFDECGNCHAELDNGRHICMSDFTVPSDVKVIMTVFRNGNIAYDNIILQKGDEIEFMPMEEE